jgi:hypothetical protein
MRGQDVVCDDDSQIRRRDSGKLGKEVSLPYKLKPLFMSNRRVAGGPLSIVYKMQYKPCEDDDGHKKNTFSTTLTGLYASLL